MDLGLKEIAIKEFSYLKTQYGFECVESGPWLVRYESETVFVNIRFDGNRSYELGCEVGRLDDFKGSSEVPFDLGEIVRSKDNFAKDIRTSFQVTSRKSFEKFVKELSSHLKDYAHDLLVDFTNGFNLVADFRDQECQAYALETTLQQTRSQLDIAWKKKDYRQIIKLLTPLKGNLNPSELKKLNYALKMKNHL